MPSQAGWPDSSPAMTNMAIRITDTISLDESEIDESFVRSSGPGGQKRNKTSSAVRVTHVPTGISAIGEESRSQHENKAAAFERLRHRLAIELRTTAGDVELPEWFTVELTAAKRLRVGRARPDYPAFAGLVLDALSQAQGSVSAAADRLGISTANLVDFLQRDEKALDQANRIRGEAGLRKLGGA